MKKGGIIAEDSSRNNTADRWRRRRRCGWGNVQLLRCQRSQVDSLYARLYSLKASSTNPERVRHLFDPIRPKTVPFAKLPARRSRRRSEAEPTGESRGRSTRRAGCERRRASRPGRSAWRCGGGVGTGGILTAAAAMRLRRSDASARPSRSDPGDAANTSNSARPSGGARTGCNWNAPRRRRPRFSVERIRWPGSRARVEELP